MKICVINGSPKGEKSVTIQYVRFLELAFPDNTFNIHHVGQKINSIERNSEELDRIISSIQDADLILWATPVYFMHIPAQLKRFVELMYERNISELFACKYAASISTSVHFFDQKVHEYLQGISEDFGMRWAGMFSAKMDDLLKPEYQQKLLIFADDIFKTCREKRVVSKVYPPLTDNTNRYLPGKLSNPVDLKGKKVLVLHDAIQGSNLESMVKSIENSFSGSVTITHIKDIGMKGGCLGCIQCGFNNECIYSDNYRSFWENTINPADILVYAWTIRDRFISSEWKEFFDRSFYQGHVPRNQGKQIILLVQGPLSQIPGLRENLTSLVSHSNVVDLISDEDSESDEIDILIRSAAGRSVDLSESGYMAPPMFPAVAGHIVLRDAVWSDLKPIFRADNRYYKAHGLYDFPQKDYRKRFSRFFFSLFMSLPPVQAKVRPKIRDYMVEPFLKVIKEKEQLKIRKNDSSKI
jgi:multimeric flavodoxin WrbA